MSKARNIADAFDANGDVAVSALDNVPPNTALVDSSDNTIVDTSTGNVSFHGELNFLDAANGAGDPTNYIDFAANSLVIRPMNSDPNYEAGLIVDKDGATRLFHNGVQKLSTESNGAKVNGDITFGTAYDGLYFPDDGLNYFGRIVGDDGTYKGIGIEHNHHISFSTGGTGDASNSTERMRINSDGNVYIYNGGDIRVHNIGNTYSADIYTDGRPYGSVSNGVDGIVWMNEFHNNSQHCTYDRSWDDYPSITVHNTTTHGPQTEFRIHGAPGDSGGDIPTSVRCDGSFYASSDSRKKVNTEEITNALDKVKALSGKSFNIVNSELNIQEDLSSEATGKKFGFIAQEAMQVIPEAVKYYEEADTPLENGYANAYSIDYSSVVALLTNAIKEQQVIIDDLKARVEALEV